MRYRLVIFGGVLFAIALRRAAEAVSRVTRLPVGWSLLAVVILIIAFFSAIGWFFSQAIASQRRDLAGEESQELGQTIGRRF